MLSEILFTLYILLEIRRVNRFRKIMSNEYLRVTAAAVKRLYRLDDVKSWPGSAMKNITAKGRAVVKN